jgi:hypothetical protein
MKPERIQINLRSGTVPEASARCCVLFPKKAIERSPQGFTKFLARICREFGGYTIDGEVSGSWMERATGVVHEDHSVVVLVALPSLPASVDGLKTVVADAARDVRELSIFMSIGDGATMFVWASQVRI